MSEEKGKYNIELECVLCHNTALLLNCDGVCGNCYESQERREKKNGRTKETIPDSLRWSVWERDNFTCQNCGNRKYLTVDHIFPESRGGELTMENTQTLCKSCNSRKGAR